MRMCLSLSAFYSTLRYVDIKILRSERMIVIVGISPVQTKAVSKLSLSLQEKWDLSTIVFL